MNKYSVGGKIPLNNYKHVLKIMKMTLSFLFSCIFFLQASNGFSQKTEFTLHLKSATIKEICEELERESDYRFIFAGNANKTANKCVDINVDSQSIEKILNKLFSDTELSYRILDYQIVVYLNKNKKNENKIERTISKQETQQSNKKQITGKIVDIQGEPVIGANIVETGTTNGTITDVDGKFSLSVKDDNATIRVSYIGYLEQSISIIGRTSFNITLLEDTQALDELLVVGYGTQKKSDITGTVASINKGRLEMVPNTNIVQAIQGAISGVMVQTTSAGATPNEAIMIRGRNSIRASNDPLIVVDGVPYGGSIRDLNPKDIETIEVLKDASAAAIYGSRGSNGVILMTTKTGTTGKAKFTYDGYYSIQKFSNLLKPLNGEEFYKFKQERFPSQITLTEQAVYDSKEWTDWLDLGLRNGYGQQHSITTSGGFNGTTYYIGAGLTDVQGLRLNDDYFRITTRFNIDTKIGGWLTLGTRTNLTYEDQSGESPSMYELFTHNPLATPYDQDGNLSLVAWPENNEANPLQPILFNNMDKSYQVVTNNFAVIDFPFVKGLSYRLNSGIRYRFRDDATYRGRDTLTGLNAGGSSNTQRRLNSNFITENILSYKRNFGRHNLFLTGVFSFEQDKFSGQQTSASQFPHDLLTYYSIDQAKIVNNEYSYDETKLVSQMLRLNYSYDSRYLLTLTGRRDGFSGFGSNSKWGVFPSVALGWNVGNEKFFTWGDLFNSFKIRASIGLNGNQAVGAYESISRLTSDDYIDKGVTLAGYRPSKLGQENLSWETSRTINFGIDLGLLNNRIVSDLNLYKTNTSDLLLNRTISSVHGITSITQNIGETQNLGIEFSVNSKNIISQGNGFTWSTIGNFAFIKNKII